jgi:hypothetical protein
LVLIAPAAVALAILILWIGRQVDTDAQVQAASSAAAQAAALQRTPSAGVDAARSTAVAMLGDSKACLGGPAISIDTTHFRPGGEVTVVVRCSPQRADLSLVDPKAMSYAATATATLDIHRAAGLP